MVFQCSEKSVEMDEDCNTLDLLASGPREKTLSFDRR